MASFAARGYKRVAPPLMEFEDTLLAGPGEALNRATFRVMDAVSHRMLGLRTDHTLQIGRLAATRLAAAPRPLRLSYAGEVLRASATDRDPTRQKTQIGIEILGSIEPDADAEVILLGLEALESLGLVDIATDLLLPTLVPALLDEEGVSGATRDELRHALDRKDSGDVARLAKGLRCGKLLLDMQQASGDMARAFACLKNAQLPARAAADRARLEKTIMRLGDKAKDMTLDLVESRCFEYQTGLSFSFFSRAGQIELGRGGRYRTASDEPATGLTFYAESLMPVLPAHKDAPQILVPFDLAGMEAKKLQAQGYALVRALGAADAKAQAHALGLKQVYDNGKVVEV